MGRSATATASVCLLGRTAGLLVSSRRCASFWTSKDGLALGRGCKVIRDGVEWLLALPAWTPSPSCDDCDGMAMPFSALCRATNGERAMTGVDVSVGVDDIGGAACMRARAAIESSRV